MVLGRQPGTIHWVLQSGQSHATFLRILGTSVLGNKNWGPQRGKRFLVDLEGPREGKLKAGICLSSELVDRAQCVLCKLVIG